MTDRRSVVMTGLASFVAAGARLTERGWFEPLTFDERRLLDEVSARTTSPRKLPWIETPQDGLSRIFAEAQLTRAIYGRDFGCKKAEAALAEPEARWIANGRAPRLVIERGGPQRLRNIKLIDRYIAVGASSDSPLLIDNCVIRAPCTDSDGGSPNAIACAPGGARLQVSDCNVSGGYQAIISLQRPGGVRRCYLADSGGDGFNLRGVGGRKILDSNLVHRLGQNSPLAHSDCVQFNPGDNSENFWITRNTLYMPGSGRFSEGTHGATSVINAGTQGGAHPIGGRATQISRIVLAGNLLVGGGYTVSWTPRAGGAVENVVSCNNIYAPTEYRSFHLRNDLIFYPGPRDSGQAGRISNLIFHNETMSDGRPVFHRGRPVEGIWHHDRERLLSDQVTLHLARKFGLVDAGGRLLPGVENKQPFLLD